MSRIPATVVTGFLGSGKTTLIQNLLRNAEGRRIGLVVNEFGDVGVDGDLLRGCASSACPAERVIELANGCICCTVADDFLPAMQALLDLTEPPEHVVIETSGLALPKPLIQAFAWPEVRTRLTVDGVVAVVDAGAVRDGLFAPDPARVAAQRAADPSLDHETPLEELFEEQLAAADLVVLNKADLVGDGDWPGVERRVRAELRPGVGVVRAREGELPPAVLLGLGASAEDDLESRRSHHDGDEPHEHDDFESFVLDVAPVDDPAAFAARVAAVAREHKVLRAKGFLAVRGRPMRLVLQAVGDRVRHHFERTPGGSGRLVVIGERGLDRAAIRRALGAGAACTS